jgi:hypothetical protein
MTIMLRRARFVKYVFTYQVKSYIDSLRNMVYLTGK